MITPFHLKISISSSLSGNQPNPLHRLPPFIRGKLLNNPDSSLTFPSQLISVKHPSILPSIFGPKRVLQDLGGDFGKRIIAHTEPSWPNASPGSSFHSCVWSFVTVVVVLVSWQQRNDDSSELDEDYSQHDEDGGAPVAVAVAVTRG